jgi:hypothetical protein
LETAAKSLEKLMEVRDLVKFGDTFREMHRDIMAAQSSALGSYRNELTLLDEIRTLKERVAEFETWETEKKRYERKSLGWGAFAYMLKPDARGTEEPHFACTNCYEHGRIVTVQFGVPKPGEGQRWFCPSCRSTIMPSRNKLSDTAGVTWLD